MRLNLRVLLLLSRLALLSNFWFWFFLRFYFRCRGLQFVVLPSSVVELLFDLFADAELQVVFESEFCEFFGCWFRAGLCSTFVAACSLSCCDFESFIEIIAVVF